MSNDKFKVKKGIKLETNSTAGDEAGELRSDGTTLKFYGTSEKTLATTDIVSGTNTGDVTLAAVGSSPNANGASLSGQQLNLQPADATNPGVVTTDAQTFAGAKTFSSTIVGSINGNAATVTTNANLSGDVSSSGNTTTIGALKVTNAMLAGSIDVTTKLNGAVPIANGGTNNASLAVTAGGTLYTDGTKVVNVGAGTSGQVLQSNGSSAPTWVTAASGGKNYITNNEATTDTTGWATYADAAGTSPVDGTGGSPSSTFARNTSTPLRGTADFLWTHSAANRQGEGFSYDFTIDAADKGKVLQGSFDYKIASGTYTDDDLQIWIYDVTNATLIQPAPYKIKNHSLAAERFPFEFQTSSSSVSYRLIVHVATTTATAYTMQIDNVSVGPNAKLYGSPVTDWQSYTLTIGATTTPPTLGTTAFNEARWRRVGDSMEILYNLSQTGAGTAGTGTYLFPLPSGYTIDSSKLTATSNFGNASVGAALVYNNSNQMTGSVQAYNSTNLALEVGDAGTNPGAVTASNAALNNATIRYSFLAKVPITGWSSSVVMSSDADTRVVAMAARKTDAQTFSAGPTKITFTVTDTDSHSKLSSSTYTIPVPGWYQISTQVQLASTNQTNGNYNQLYIYRNGSAIAQTQIPWVTSMGVTSMQISKVYYCNAGDTIEIYAGSGVSNATIDVSNSVIWNYFNVHRLSGPAQIAASEKIVFNATASGQTPQALSNTTAWTLTKVDDTHGGFNGTTTYTIQSPGYYFISAMFDMGAVTTGSVNNVVQAYVMKNGSAIITGTTRSQVSAALNDLQIVAQGAKLFAVGDAITFNLNTNFGTPGTTGSAVITIYRI